MHTRYSPRSQTISSLLPNFGTARSHPASPSFSSTKQKFPKILQAKGKMGMKINAQMSVE